MMGQELLRDPDREVFATLAPLFASADLRFVNLESPISDQGGVTGSTENSRIFVGPPPAARTLGRAGITVVSTANNHAWDYGKAALLETMDRLDAEGVRYVGTGRTRAEAYAPLVIERGGFRVGFLAVTDIWNQGPLREHVARELVAMADPEDLAASVRALRAQPGIDAVVVSYHGGSEYMEEPLQSTRRVLHAAIDAGADVVLGHHPHAVQGVGWYAGKPILYSLGNLIMGMNPKHPWSELGYLARVTLRRGAGALIEACPYRLHGRVPIPLAADPNRALTEQRFFPKLAAISRRVAGTAIGPVAPDGCAPLGPPAEPVAGAVP